MGVANRAPWFAGRSGRVGSHGVEKIHNEFRDIRNCGSRLDIEADIRASLVTHAIKLDHCHRSGYVRQRGQNVCCHRCRDVIGAGQYEDGSRN